MFCGHDHDNDFTINLYGIRLSFGRVGGYNTYGDFTTCTINRITTS